MFSTLPNTVKSTAEETIYFLNNEEQHKIIVETEEAILCSMILNNSSIDYIGTTIKENWFFTNQNKIIFKACIELYKNHNSVTIQLLRNHLVNNKKFSVIGGDNKIERILSKASISFNKESSALILKEKYLRKKLIEESENIKKRALDFSKSVLDSIEESEEIIAQIKSESVIGEEENTTWQELGVKIVSEISDNWDGTANNNIYYSGLVDFDNATGGLSPGEFIMIAGPSGIGKTAFGCSLMLDYVKRGVSCLFLTGEMTPEQVGKRVLAAQTGIDSKLLIKQNKLLAQNQIADLYQSILNTESYPMAIASCSAGISGIMATIKRATDEALDAKMPGFDGQFKIIFLDYLQLLSSSESDNHSLEVDKLAKWCKLYAKDNNCVFIAFAQVNDDVLERSGNKVPNINDVGWCRTAKNHADYLAFLWTEYYNNLNTKNQLPNRPDQEILEIHFRKSRHTGNLGVVETLFSLPVCRVVSVYRNNRP